MYQAKKGLSAVINPHNYILGPDLSIVRRPTNRLHSMNAKPLNTHVCLNLEANSKAHFDPAKIWHMPSKLTPPPAVEHASFTQLFPLGRPGLQSGEM